MSLYCAVFTSLIAPDSEESFRSEDFGKALDFIIEKVLATNYKQAFITRENNEVRETVLWMRNIK